MKDRAKEYYSKTSQDRFGRSTGSARTLTVSESKSLRILDLEDALIDLAAKYELACPQDSQTCSIVKEAKNIIKRRKLEYADGYDADAED